MSETAKSKEDRRHYVIQLSSGPPENVVKLGHLLAGVPMWDEKAGLERAKLMALRWSSVATPPMTVAEMETLANRIRRLGYHGWFVLEDEAEYERPGQLKRPK